MLNLQDWAVPESYDSISVLWRIEMPLNLIILNIINNFVKNI